MLFSYTFLLLKCLLHFCIIYHYLQICIVTFEGLSDLIHSRDFFKDFSQDSDTSAHEHSLSCHSATIRSIGIVLWDENVNNLPMFNILAEAPAFRRDFSSSISFSFLTSAPIPGQGEEHLQRTCIYQCKLQ